MTATIKQYLPDALTCCNLLSGCIATYLAIRGSASLALTFIIVGAVFDFLDGMTARLLGVSSPIGKQLDSLADDITFGLAPAAIVFVELKIIDYPAWMEQSRSFLPFVAFLIAVFSAVRLAKFNVDSRQKMTFIGLPTPANALFWGSLTASGVLHGIPACYLLYIILLLVLVSCWLLVSELPMFAMKFSHWGWHNNEVKYCFAVLALLLIILLGLEASLWIIVALYVVISLFTRGKKA